MPPFRAETHFCALTSIRVLAKTRIRICVKGQKAKFHSSFRLFKYPNHNSKEFIKNYCIAANIWLCNISFKCISVFYQMLLSCVLGIEKAEMYLDYPESLAGFWPKRWFVCVCVTAFRFESITLTQHLSCHTGGCHYDLNDNSFALQC